MSRLFIVRPGASRQSIRDITVTRRYGYTSMAAIDINGDEIMRREFTSAEAKDSEAARRITREASSDGPDRFVRTVRAIFGDGAVWAADRGDTVRLHR